MSSGINIVGLILAGGQARRMGGVDKALTMLRGQTLLERAIARARPQVDELLVNANGDLSRFERFGVPVIADRMSGFLGPLAGILTGLEWLREDRPQAKWLATFATDTPFFPNDLVARLIEAAERTHSLVSVAASGGQRHNIFGVWSTAIAETSQSVLEKRALRKMDDFIDMLPNTSVEFSAREFDPFFNINTPDDLAAAEAIAGAL